LSVDAWQLLGLAPTDDLRAIKRAYAACLKRCRPEDDAAGFVRLRGAYEYLLAQVEARARPRVDMPIAARGIEVSPPAAVEFPLAPIDAAASLGAEVNVPAPRAPQQVAADVLVQACQAQGYDATAEFATWLAANPDLMLLDDKPLVSRLVLAQILGGQAPTPEVFGALQAFFHWDDRVEQRRLAQAGLQVESALAEVRAARLRRELAKGVARKAPVEGRLDAVRRAGTGWRAWWLALTRRSPYTAPELLRDTIEVHGYRAVEQVFGAELIAFWERAITPRPTPIQWIVGLLQPLLVGALLALVGVILGTIGALLADDHDGHAAREAFLTPTLIMGLTGLALAGFAFVLKFIGLSMRSLALGPLPAVLARWHDLRERCALDRRWRTALPATVMMLAVAWYWPAAVSPMPFLILVAALLLLHLRNVRSIIGLVFVLFGAFPLFALHGAALPLVAASLPPSLWLGHATHEFLSRRRPGPTHGNTVMMVGLAIAVTMLVMSGRLVSL
jgi:hypothetical protein